MTHDVEKPARMRISHVDGYRELMAAKGEVENKNVFALHGMAFMQGERIRFVTAMSIGTYLDIVRDPADTVAKRNSAIDAIEEKANRPTDDAHRKRIAGYIKEELGQRKPAELGGFTLNFGLEVSNDADNDCQLYILGDHDFVTAPALLVIHNPEPSFRMHVTDGAHRTRSLIGIMADKNVKPDVRANILDNGVPVTFVFEPNMAQAHQDFADAALAKPIKDSIRVGFDIRNDVNSKTVAMIKASDLLRERVSMTAASVNVAARSKQGILFNSPAVTMFIRELKLRGNGIDPQIVADLWDTLPKYFPVFRPLGNENNTNAVRIGKLEADLVTNNRLHYRTFCGGTLLLKAAFCGLMARVVLEAKARGIKPEAILSGMAKLNWYIFNDATATAAYETLQSKGQGLTPEALATFNPMMSPVVVRAETRFKMSTTGETLDQLWDNICQEMWHEPSRIDQPAAEAAE